MDVMLILAALIILGAASQWLAWRLKLPAILFLLGLGILSGPVLGILHPGKLFGALLFPGVSLAVAVILFEGALNLKLKELGKLGRVVRRIVGLGAISSWLILAVATHWITGFRWPMSVLFGAVIVVSGPTVIGPILRAARPNERIRNVLQWEGILLDPIGALLSVLVFEGIVSRHGGSALSSTVEIFLRAIATGFVTGFTGGYGLGWLLRKRAIPDYLHGVVALGTVFMVFAAANSVAVDSGLLAVTLMGIWLANMQDVPLDNILNFKESLSILLISLLFLLLAARLQLEALEEVLPWGLAIFLAIQLVAQPVKVLLASDGREMNWRERFLTAWVAPRGIVAAAGAPIYAIQLEAHGYPQASLFVPLTFAVILLTVLSASFSTRPLALLLGVAETSPRGVLIIGANPFAIAVADKLQKWGFHPLLINDDFRQLQQARMLGIRTFFGSPVSEAADRKLGLDGFGYLLALSSDPARNLIATLRYAPEFGYRAVYTLSDGSHREKSARLRIARRHRQNSLFSAGATAAELLARIDKGWTVKITSITPQFTWEDYRRQFSGTGFLPLFVLREEKLLAFVSGIQAEETIPVPGDKVMSLVAARGGPLPGMHHGTMHPGDGQSPPHAEGGSDLPPCL